MRYLDTERTIGTTETQRAVSYYEIPSRLEDPGYLDKMGDVIPAGMSTSYVTNVAADDALFYQARE